MGNRKAISPPRLECWFIPEFLCLTGNVDTFSPQHRLCSELLFRHAQKRCDLVRICRGRNLVCLLKSLLWDLQKTRLLQKLVKVVSLVLRVVAWRQCSEEVVTAYWSYSYWSLRQYATTLRSLSFPFYSCDDLLRLSDLQREGLQGKSAQGRVRIQLVYFLLWLYHYVVGA